MSLQGETQQLSGQVGWSRNVPKYSKLLEKASVIVVPKGGSRCEGVCNMCLLKACAPFDDTCRGCCVEQEANHHFIALK